MVSWMFFQVIVILKLSKNEVRLLVTGFGFSWSHACYSFSLLRECRRFTLFGHVNLRSIYTELTLIVNPLRCFIYAPSVSWQLHAYTELRLCKSTSAVLILSDLCLTRHLKFAYHPNYSGRRANLDDSAREFIQKILIVEFWNLIGDSGH